MEIYQNCIVYNDDVFAGFADKNAAPDNQIWLEDGRPVLFAGGTKGLRMNRADLKLHVVDVVAGGWRAADVIVHDRTNRGLAQMLIDLGPADGLPVALGVIYDRPRPTFDRAVGEQNLAASAGKKPDLQALIAKGRTWQIEKEPHLI